MVVELQVGVKILIKNSEDKYLLLRRSPEKYPETQKWDIPGGRINPGTTLMENLTREVREETALEVLGTPRFIAAQDILKVAEKHVVRLTYVGQARGTIQLSDEHIEYKWFTLDEMHALELLDSYVKTLLSGKFIS
jgi:8-oxo-dGTP diphosphatase